MLSFNTVKVTFENYRIANSCLEILDKKNKEEKENFYTYIQERAVRSKGVISNWKYSVEKLIEAITDKTRITKIERMKRKKWDKINKKLIDEYKDKLIIITEGKERREKNWDL